MAGSILRFLIPLVFVAAVTACGGGGDDPPAARIWPTAGPAAAGTIRYPGPNTQFILPFVGQGVSTSFTNTGASARTVDVTLTMSATLRGPATGHIDLAYDIGDSSHVEQFALADGVAVPVQRVYTFVLRPGQSAVVQADAFIDTAPGVASIDWSGANATFVVAR